MAVETGDVGSDPDRAADLDLVQRVLAGDTDARDRLIQRLARVPRILATLNSRMGYPLTTDDLEDLNQDTLIFVWSKLGTFEGRARLETWTYRFCFLSFMNFVRKQDRQGKVRGPRLDKVVEDLPAPREAVVLDLDAVLIELDEIGSPDADVIRLKYFEEKTFSEIAALLRVSASSAKSYFHRGMGRLRRRFCPGEGS